MSVAESPEVSDPDRDRVAEALADLDDALVAGKEATAEVEKADDPALREELKRGASFLWLLEQAWPRRVDEATLDDNGESTLKGSAAVQDALEAQPTLDDPIFGDEGPTRFGRFEILRTLGRGGFGIVFLAWDPRLRRKVALKVPQPEVLASPEARRRFLREARAAGGLDHPDIIPIHETGTIGAVHYIASSYCEGPTLEEWLGAHRDDPAPLPDAARLVRDLALAVQHAHDRGVLHRDLKPSNVLLQPRGEAIGGLPADRDLSSFSPRLADFSLARIADDEGTRTLSGIPLGSPSYMAPEQAEGKSAEMGPATDVYGLGSLLYVLLVGRPPFEGESQVETLRRIINDDPIAPRRLRREVPPSLEAIALHCLEKSRANRYASARELADDLERFLDDGAVSVRPPGIGTRASRLIRRHRYPLTAAAFMAVFATALLSGIAWSRNQLKSVRAVADQRAEESNKFKQISSRLAYVADIRDASRALDEGSTGLARTILERHRPHAAGQDDLRDFAWYHLRERRPTSERMILVGHDGEAYHVEFSPDGSTLASCGKDGTVRLWEAATGISTRAIHADQSELNWVSFSPDGASLATAGDDGTVKLWDAKTGGNRGILKGHTGECSVALFTPQGNKILSCGRSDGMVKVWDLGSGSEERSFQTGHPLIENMAIYPAGGRLATVGNTDAVRIWDLHALRLISEYKYPGVLGFDSLAFSHSGTQMATGSGMPRADVHLWDLNEGRSRYAARGHRDKIRSVAFSPDDRTIVSSGLDERIRLWDAGTGVSLGAFPGDQGRVWCVNISPDGGTIASVGKTGAVKLWDSKPIRAWSEVAPGDEPNFGGWSQAGELLLSTIARSSRRRLALWSRAPRSSEFRETKASEVDGRYDEFHGLLHECALSGNHAVFVRASDPAAIEIWEPSRDLPTAVLMPANAGIITRVDLDRHGRWLAVAVEGRGISFWDLRSFKEIAFLEGPGKLCRGVSAGGEVFITQTGGEFLWTPSSRAPAQTATPGPLSDFRLDGNFRGQAIESIIKFWDFEPFRRARDSIGNLPNRVSDLDISPDGKVIAFGDFDGNVKIWDSETRQELLSWDGLGMSIGRVMFSPDGMSLAVLVNGPIKKRVLVFSGLRENAIAQESR